jgi:hypothetical protein
MSAGGLTDEEVATLRPWLDRVGSLNRDQIRAAMETWPMADLRAVTNISMRFVGDEAYRERFKDSIEAGGELGKRLLELLVAILPVHGSA